MKVEKRNLLTIQDLFKFCQENKLYNFSSKEHGYKLKVQIPSSFEMDDNVDDNHRGMLKLKIRIFHTGLNRNGSFVSEEAAKDAMPTIKNRPVLAAIHQLDNGDWDFEGHNFEIITNEDGTEEINYIEKQVGSFDESEPFFEYDKDLDKTYICSYAYIPEDYTRAAEIIRAKNGTKNSVELSIDELSFNAKENYLSLDKFYVSASTLLGSRDDGTEIGEGMLGSRADIADFSEKNNTSQFDVNKELLDEIKKLNENLSHFNINKEDSKSSKIYGKEEIEVDNQEILVNEEVVETEEVAEVVANEVVETLEEEVEVAEEESTEEVVETEEVEDPVEDETPEVVEEFEEVTEETVEETVEESFEESDNTTEEVKPEKYSITMSNGMVKEFALSLDEINYALYSLVNDTYSESDNAWYGVSVYEDGTLIMYDYWNGKAFRQSYKREEDNFSLIGDRVPVKQIWVTDEEEASLNEMKSNYVALEQFKLDAENAELRAQKEAILYNEKYSVIAEKDENNEYKNASFAKLVSEMDNYSLTDLEKELKSVFADYITNGGQFAYAEEEKSVVSKKLFAASTGKKSSRYGNLFNK